MSSSTAYDLGTMSGTSVSGTLYVYNSAVSTTVMSAGIEVVFAAGIDSAGIVSSGGVQYDSGTARNDIVRGGVQNVYGTASGTVVSAGYQVVVAGGTASNTVVSNGGSQFISGTAFNTVVLAG